MPNPPNSINISIKIFPKYVKSLAVSNTTNPVTHTALVEVNKASINDIFFTVDAGSINKIEPKKDKKTKLVINMKAGL